MSNNDLSEILKIADLEFEYVFGPILKERKSTPDLNDVLEEVFYEGVEYGIEHPNDTQSDLLLAGGERHDPSTAVSSDDRNARKFCQSCFLYGAGWVINLFRLDAGRERL